RDDYYGRDLALGLRHPLLGSLKRQQDALRSVEDQRQLQSRLLLLALVFDAAQRILLALQAAQQWMTQAER
ncbi:hypothetical protein, partial [Aeromonas caviae]|uniref:hypothetical protein n=1 Tax=Aeromonas caviae TaxID=648 RepID=UPI001CC33E11